MSASPFPDSWPAFIRPNLTERGGCKHTWKTSPNHGNDIGVVDVRLQDQGTNTVDYNDGLLVDGSNGSNQIVPIMPGV